MSKKFWIVGGVAAAAVLVGSLAWAQSNGHGPGGFGHGGMMGMHGQMGSGMQGQMGPGMMGQMGGGMMGMGHGSATVSEHQDISTMLFNNNRIRRAVTNLPDGIRTVTESDDPNMAEVLKRHVTEMGKRVEEGRDPGLPIESPALHAIFRDKDKIKSTYETTEKGIVVIQTSTDAAAVKALQDHAAEVSDLAKRGMVAAHEAMMKNAGGGAGHGMHGGMRRSMDGSHGFHSR